MTEASTLSNTFFESLGCADSLNALRIQAKLLPEKARDMDRAQKTRERAEAAAKKEPK